MRNSTKEVRKDVTEKNFKYVTKLYMTEMITE